MEGGRALGDEGQKILDDKQGIALLDVKFSVSCSHSLFIISCFRPSRKVWGTGRVCIDKEIAGKSEQDRFGLRNFCFSCAVGERWL